MRTSPLFAQAFPSAGDRCRRFWTPTRRCRARQPAPLRTASEGTPVDLRYEITERERDIVSLRDGEEALMKELARTVPAFNDERERVAELHSDIRSHATERTSDLVWITDRDGTANNCGARYLTSVQSIYNAVWMTRFARSVVGP